MTMRLEKFTNQCPVAEVSWWKYSSYLLCPQQYNWKHISRKSAPKDSKINAVFGIIMQKLFERWVNEERYENTNNGIDWMRIAAENELYILESKERIPWGERDIFRPAVLADINSCIEPCIQQFIIMGWTKNTMSEVPIEADWGNVRIGCRADFIIQNKDGSVWIVDGKGSKSTSYTVKEQVKWNALCYHLATGKLPDKVGFFYWRKAKLVQVRGWGAEEEKKFCDVTRLNLNKLISGNFEAEPSENSCMWCPWRETCEQRTDMIRDYSSKDNLPSMTSTIGDGDNVESDIVAM